MRITTTNDKWQQETTTKKQQMTWTNDNNKLKPKFGAWGTHNKCTRRQKRHIIWTCKFVTFESLCVLKLYPMTSRGGTKTRRREIWWRQGVAPGHVEKKSGGVKGGTEKCGREIWWSGGRIVTRGRKRKSRHSIESSFVVVPFVLYSLSCCVS